MLSKLFTHGLNGGIENRAAMGEVDTQYRRRPSEGWDPVHSSTDQMLDRAGPQPSLGRRDEFLSGSIVLASPFATSYKADFLFFQVFDSLITTMKSCF